MHRNKTLYSRFATTLSPQGTDAFDCAFAPERHELLEDGAGVQHDFVLPTVSLQTVFWSGWRW
jgi:hypothetical protein